MSAHRWLVVGLGEALFDCFADDREVVGGAPVNVARHVRQLLTPDRAEVALVTRVGRDERGDRLTGQAARWGLETRWVQADPDRPTGRVVVTIGADGEPGYNIRADAAWDALAWVPGLEDLACRASAVVYGTLARRSTSADAAIGRFLAASTGAIRFFDANLRQAYGTPALIVAGLRSATVLKVSASELPVVWRAAAQAGDVSGDGDADARCEGLRRAYGLSMVVLTRGRRGTVLFGGGGRVEGEPVPAAASPGADAVGAGDACSAAVIAGLLRGLPASELVALANAVGAYVASVAGPTPTLPDALRAATLRP